MSFDITGKLYKKFETQQIKETFKKREFILETDDGSYRQLIKFQLTQDRCDLLEGFQEQQEIEVKFDINGNEYKKPTGEVIYFTNLNAWQIKAGATGSDAPDEAFDSDGSDSIGGGESTSDDLPF